MRACVSLQYIAGGVMKRDLVTRNSRSLIVGLIICYKPDYEKYIKLIPEGSLIRETDTARTSQLSLFRQGVNLIRRRLNFKFLYRLCTRLIFVFRAGATFKHVIEPSEKATRKRTAWISSVHQLQ